MKNFSRLEIYLLIFIGIILFAFFISFFNHILDNKMVFASQNDNGSDNPCGRYQIEVVPGGAGVILLDTKTGKIWLRSIFNDKQLRNKKEGIYFWDYLSY
ncbi:MAG TPA: hypothetical protein PK449_03970 [Exilispira sp.]|nr:hypothetical protein [Exilispira sp.]HQJ40694.1 hypothetical protein [Exilispira sp.]